jgi:hypothetical protein
MKSRAPSVIASVAVGLIGSRPRGKWTVRSASADPEKAKEAMAEFALPTGAREWDPDPP